MSKQKKTEIGGIEAFRIDEKKLSSSTILDSGEWARYCLRSAARILTLCGKVPVVQYEGDQVVLYGVDPSALSGTENTTP